ncbi:MAG TPA: acyl carrier protein [Anaerolineaceae bacterium]|nr:acyl carrier protein [Anaerolineaceae bacterium]HOH20874.1 acyl carrier protein [Anaerolineaceae bacterium]HPA34413.1 acyl carrier protein [Anaerolineaceae bacterium]HQP61883.1 acyl carrier protein [Anaerolineaceae bacterium]
MTEMIREKVRKFISETILFSTEGYPYPDDASFLENGIVDSMNVMELVMFVENHFGIKVDDSEIIPDHFDSVQQITAFVHGKQNHS